MSKRLFAFVALVALGATHASGVSAQNLNVTGVWKGVNYTSQVPGPHEVVLSLSQTGSKVTGFFWVATGVYGTGVGQVTGPNAMTMAWTNTSPNCPGAYKNVYAISGSEMTWTFTGKDCLGPEQGKGEAARIVTLKGAPISRKRK